MKWHCNMTNCHSSKPNKLRIYFWRFFWVIVICKSKLYNETDTVYVILSILYHVLYELSFENNWYAVAQKIGAFIIAILYVDFLQCDGFIWSYRAQKKNNDIVFPHYYNPKTCVCTFYALFYVKCLIIYVVKIF